MTGFEIPILLQIFLFPIFAILLWYFLFNNTNTIVTKVVVEGGYMILGIPLIIFTLLSIPMLFLLFWAPSQGITREVTIAIGIVLLILTIIAEYYWIRKQVRAIEEKEGISFWNYVKREMSSETRANRKEKKTKNREQTDTYFDDITEMNRQKRELDRKEKEKLRRALLGDLDSDE